MFKVEDFQSKYIKKINLTHISLLLIFIGLFITVFCTYQISKLNSKFSELFYNYLSPNIILLSIGIFLLFKNMKFNNFHINKFLGIISKYSYGIYLIHVFVLFFLNKIGLNGIFINPLIGIPFVTLICFFISFGIIYFLNKIKFLKPFIG
jgi:hypothetical protein